MLYIILLFIIFVLCFLVFLYVCFFFFKQKTAYEMRISDWSSDVCSSDLSPSSASTVAALVPVIRAVSVIEKPSRAVSSSICRPSGEIGRASCRERVCQYV